MGDAELLSDAEREQAFDMGAQMAALQARSLRELQRLLRMEEAARHAAEQKLSDETLLWRAGLDERLKAMSDQTRGLQHRLDDEVTARKELEQQCVEERTARHLMRHRLNEEEESRLQLEKRLREEEEAGALLKKRLEENIAARNALEVRVEQLEATCAHLTGENKKLVDDRLEACENEASQIKTNFGMFRKEKETNDIVVGDKIAALEAMDANLLDKLETAVAVNNTDKDKRGNEEAANREALRTLLVEKDYLAHQRMDEMVVSEKAESRRLEKRIANEEDARHQLYKSFTEEQAANEKMNETVQGSVVRLTSLESRMTQHDAIQSASEMSMRKLCNEICTENNVVVMKTLDEVKDALDAESAERKKVNVQLEDEIGARQRLTNSVNTEKASLQLLTDRVNRMPALLSTN